MKTNQLIDAGVAASLAASAAFRAHHQRIAMVVIVASMAIAMALATPAAHAQSRDAQTAGEPVPNSEVGHSTQAWLDLQRSNAQAAPALPMLGEEAGYAWRRYMKSFDTDIPSSFGSTIQTGTGQGGSGGATMGGGGAY